ncbi:MAG: hypothetical protein AAGK21_14650 [Bacteroidota bacterium]
MPVLVAAAMALQGCDSQEILADNAESLPSTALVTQELGVYQMNGTTSNDMVMYRSGGVSIPPSDSFFGDLVGSQNSGDVHIMSEDVEYQFEISGSSNYLRIKYISAPPGTRKVDVFLDYNVGVGSFVDRASNGNTTTLYAICDIDFNERVAGNWDCATRFKGNGLVF